MPINIHLCGVNHRKIQQKLDDKFHQIVIGNGQVMKEAEVAEQAMDLEVNLEQSPITSEKIAETVKKLEERLEQDSKNKPLKKAKHLLEKDLLPQKQKYAEQKATFGERNSYSKTDTDATFMRMKEDHMMNGQLKPGYNV